MLKKLSIMIVGFGLLASAAIAQTAPEKKPAAAGKKATTKKAAAAAVDPASLPAYGMAGCGLGALLIEKNEMFPQIGAWFLNGLWGHQTSAITTGSSNCSDDPREVAQVEQEVFIVANLNSISKEAVQGSGKHLDALAEVFGCSEDGTSALRNVFKDKHDVIFSSQDSKEVLSTIRNEIKSNQQLAGNCNRA
jgi:hypothetical protein